MQLSDLENRWNFAMRWKWSCRDAFQGGESPKNHVVKKTPYDTVAIIKISFASSTNCTYVVLALDLLKSGKIRVFFYIATFALVLLFLPSDLWKVIPCSDVMKFSSRVVQAHLRPPKCTFQNLTHARFARKKRTRKVPLGIASSSRGKTFANCSERSDASLFPWEQPELRTTSIRKEAFHGKQGKNEWAMPRNPILFAKCTDNLFH